MSRSTLSAGVTRAPDPPWPAPTTRADGGQKGDAMIVWQKLLLAVLAAAAAAATEALVAEAL